MRFTVLIALVLTVCPAAPAADSGGTKNKKLIEFGWDEPDTAYMRAHVAEMESTPFEGVVFDIKYLKDGKADGPFISEAWGKRAFTAADLQSARDDLRATPFKRFTENFLRFNVTPGDVDWFDDEGFRAIEGNAKLAAEVARDGHGRGILFDIEEYAFPLFTYPKQMHAKDKSWADYSRQARLRGAQIMRAFQVGYPGVTVLFTFGYTLPYAYTHHDPTKLDVARYGLLAPFLDGMLDAAAPDTKLVDGYERSYAFQSAQKFDGARHEFEAGVLPYVVDADRYRARFRLGFGLWLDEDWRKRGWDPSDPSKNYFTPAKFQAAVSDALRASDEYVWIYTETPRWWTPSGKPKDLPAAYEAALRDSLRQIRGGGADAGDHQERQDRKE
ncbi:MAG TPA: hypothetical protein VGI81_20050 [Tepidisphaeraceae bacterium]|jgi:hypothetical protein